MRLGNKTFWSTWRTVGTLFEPTLRYNLRYVISKYLNNSESQLQNQQSFNVYILGKSI